jgi:predicted AAA+ superfamily ATPase
MQPVAVTVDYARSPVSTPLLTAITPRRGVLAGELTESRFAAGLEDMIAVTVADTYGDPGVFFAQTYPNEGQGLRILLNEALGRLFGSRPDAAIVLCLETNFGGGKTHNLIALFHAVRGYLKTTLHLRQVVRRALRLTRLRRRTRLRKVLTFW